MPVIAQYGGKLIVGDFELKKLEGKIPGARVARPGR
jgi:uncharacterized protein (DUF1330 family)